MQEVREAFVNGQESEESAGINSLRRILWAAVDNKEVFG